MGILRQVYRSYLRGPNHPMKGRVLGLLERTIVPDEGIPSETDGGVRMYLHPRRYWERHLLSGGQYHSGLTHFIRMNIRAGETVAFAGISFGQQVIVASRVAGAHGRVVGIDPHPAALMQARNNIALNELPNNVFLVCAALSDHSAILPMSATVLDHVGEGSFIKPAGSFPYYVPVDTLPAVLGKLNIDALDMLFLDVIGFELPILAALEAPYLPRLITVAVHSWVCRQMNLTLLDYQNRLVELGYECSTLEGTPTNDVCDLRECQLVALKNGAATPAWLSHDPSIPTGVWM
jgi:FkbM family methyltransferase